MCGPSFLLPFLHPYLSSFLTCLLSLLLPFFFPSYLSFFSSFFVSFIFLSFCISFFFLCFFVSLFLCFFVSLFLCFFVSIFLSFSFFAIFRIFFPDFCMRPRVSLREFVRPSVGQSVILSSKSFCSRVTIDHLTNDWPSVRLNPRGRIVQRSLFFFIGSFLAVLLSIDLPSCLLAWFFFCLRSFTNEEWILKKSSLGLWKQIEKGTDLKFPGLIWLQKSFWNEFSSGGQLRKKQTEGKMGWRKWRRFINQTQREGRAAFGEEEVKQGGVAYEVCR